MPAVRGSVTIAAITSCLCLTKAGAARPSKCVKPVSKKERRWEKRAWELKERWTWIQGKGCSMTMQEKGGGYLYPCGGGGGYGCGLCGDTQWKPD